MNRLSLKAGWLRDAIDRAYTWAAVNRGYADELARNLGVAPPAQQGVVGALYACGSCGARFVSNGGRIVAGGCPNDRPTCPLEPVTADSTASTEPMLIAGLLGQPAPGELMAKES